MEIDRNKLPEDPRVLQQMVVSLLAERDSQEQRLRQVQHLLEQLLRARYGPRRERVNENQLFLFAVTILSARPQTTPTPEKSETPSTRVRAMGGSVCRRRWSGGGWSMISVSRNGSVRSARENCATSVKRSANAWSTYPPRCK